VPEMQTLTAALYGWNSCCPVCQCAFGAAVPGLVAGPDACLVSGSVQVSCLCVCSVLCSAGAD
jgi:hypothetical protein